MWRLLLEQKRFVEAEKFCTDPAQRDRVMAAHADYLLSEYVAQTSVCCIISNTVRAQG